jgi:hypothetical protein
MRPPDFRPVRPPPAVAMCSSCCLSRAPPLQRFQNHTAHFRRSITARPEALCSEGRGANLTRQQGLR